MRRTWKIQFSLLLSALIILGLMTGCYKEVAPDVTATPGAGALAVGTEEPTDGGFDLAGTAIANTTLAAELAEETPATETPVEPSATLTPTVEPSPVPTAPPPTDTPLPATPAPSPAPPATGPVTHVVQRGQNLFRIALSYGTTVEAIASANGIANPALIYVGQKLTIPSATTQPSPATGDGTTYTVQPGDNLFRIAMRYNMNYLYLAQYNGIVNPSNIYVGQVLRIPPH